MGEQDCLDKFIAEKCKVDQSKSTLCRELYQAYRDFCNEQNLRIRSASNFSASLVNRFPFTRRKVAGGFYTLDGISL